MSDTELSDIAAEESGETFDSITDLDNISDTTVLAITFLLSAQVSLTTYVVGAGTLAGRREVGFVVLGLCTMAMIFLSLNAIVKTLLPVGFYGERVGEPLLDRPWIPAVVSTPGQFGFLSGEESDEPAREPEAVAEEFLETYSPHGDVSSLDEYHVAKLAHLKTVGERKARLTGVGLSWLRWAVAVFILQFAYLFVGGVLL